MTQCRKGRIRALVLAVMMWSTSSAMVPALDAGAETTKDKGSVVFWDGDRVGRDAEISAVGNNEAVSKAEFIKRGASDERSGLQWNVSGKGWQSVRIDWDPKDKPGRSVKSYRNLICVVRVEVTDPANDPSSLKVSAILEGPKGGSAGNDLNKYDEDLTDGKWHEVVVPLSEFLRDEKKPFDLAQVKGITFGHWSREKMSFTVYVDRVGFDNRTVVDLISLPEKRDPAPVDGSLTDVRAAIDLKSAGKNVNQYIYGTKDEDPDMCREMGVTIRRVGGNHTSVYDWRTGYTSLGGDWFFSNYTIKGDHPKDNLWTQNFRASKERGMESYLTLPALGWVAKDGTSLGFPKSLYPDQTGFDPDKGLAGNGKAPRRDAQGNVVKDKNGKTIEDWIRVGRKYPSQNGKKVTPEEQCELLRYCIKEAGFGTAKRGGVKYVCLDNEPMLWPSTHADMTGQGMTYEQFWEWTRTYCEILKKIDPDVKIAAPALWGWTAFFHSSADQMAMDERNKREGKSGWNGDYLEERKAKGPFLLWFMKQLAAYEKQHGKKLVDILDIHMYANSHKVEDRHNMTPETREMRIRDCRKFWDESYRDPDCWYSGDNGGNIAFIPLVRNWMKEAGIDLETACGEYGLFYAKDVVSALRQAETFAAFAIGGLDYGLRWSGFEKNSPDYFAWKMFRNPDGRHTAVGNCFLPYVMAPEDFDRASVYCYRDEKTKRLSFIVLNKRSAEPVRVTIDLNRAVRSQSVVPYEYSAVNLKAIGELPVMKIGGMKITLTLAPFTLLRFDVKE